MNDLVAKIVLGVIALAAICAVVIIQTGAAIAPLLTLASFCAGGVAGVAVQGAFKPVPISTIVEPVLSETTDA